MIDPAKTNAAQILDGVRYRLQGLLEKATALREKLDAEAALLQSMDRLARQARDAIPPPISFSEPRQPEDGSFLSSDSWHIALINEDGS